MPIRFRCQYCNQLMGIARRKAGTEVECPTCKGKMVVPSSSDAHVPVGSGANQPPFFEQHDFDFLNVPQQPEPIPEAPRPQPAPQPPRSLPGLAPPAYNLDVDLMPGAMALPTDPGVGIYLSPTRATLLTVAVILGFALAFSAGLLVGRAL
jgi:hypothetical protein